jgi:hypothetical protein
MDKHKKRKNYNCDFFLRRAQENDLISFGSLIIP